MGFDTAMRVIDVYLGSNCLLLSESRTPEIWTLTALGNNVQPCATSVVSQHLVADERATTRRAKHLRLPSCLCLSSIRVNLIATRRTRELRCGGRLLKRLRSGFQRVGFRFLVLNCF